MKALVFYDETGRIWLIAYNETTMPPGALCMWVDIEDGAVLDRIDLTDPENPVPVFSEQPDTQLGKLMKDMAAVQKKTAELTAIISPTIDEATCTLDEFKAWKKSLLHDECTEAIFAGITVTLTDGTVESYSLTEYDQLNLFGKQAQIDKGVEQLEYHANGQPCRYYSTEDMELIITAAMAHVSYHTTYCNALNLWIAGCESKDEVREIFYGADVPEQYRSEVLQAYLVEIAAMAEESVDETVS